MRWIISDDAQRTTLGQVKLRLWARKVLWSSERPVKRFGAKLIIRLGKSLFFRIVTMVRKMSYQWRISGPKISADDNFIWESYHSIFDLLTVIGKSWQTNPNREHGLSNFQVKTPPICLYFWAFDFSGNLVRWRSKNWHLFRFKVAYFWFYWHAVWWNNVNMSIKARMYANLYNSHLARFPRKSNAQNFLKIDAMLCL